METVDVKKVRMALLILATVLDRLIELDDREPDLDFNPWLKIDEVDRIRRYRDYCRDCECCEGMDW